MIFWNTSTRRTTLETRIKKERLMHVSFRTVLSSLLRATSGGSQNRTPHKKVVPPRVYPLACTITRHLIIHTAVMLIEDTPCRWSFHKAYTLQQQHSHRGFGTSSPLRPLPLLIVRLGDGDSALLLERAVLLPPPSALLSFRHAACRQSTPTVMDDFLTVS